MHILLALLGIVGGGLFWWYRMRTLGDAASDVIDTAGKARGYLRRRKIRIQHEHSPLTAIEDPVLAAATLIFAIVCEDTPITEKHYEAVRNAIIDICDPAKADEAVIYAKWASSQIDDAVTVIEKTAPLLRQRLNDMEKLELIDMVGKAAAAVTVPPTYGQRVKKLKQKLGLEVD
ncbi:putative tellurite resistance protein B-like protein [Phyllobacterium ifriqiyense]|uniref:Tellurite resistance protein B-like protein n=1 Tax=Phyllobacterium ifriqiyense TaxID=314238 RepID=A0ABU0S9D6_9HYPH|nr:hypothetical protein [Phyllobacterium ifriqiyense]MDQ0997377.1 putative tellurite resistance protein B-like protein [Phyllobacterium ifriqiyense]